MNTTKLEYLAERMRLQKESMLETAKQNERMAEVTALTSRIWQYPAAKAERERLQNSLMFFGIVNWLAGNGCNDRQITEAVDYAVAKGVVARTEENTERLENFDRVTAALCALELEELGLVTMDSLMRIRISLD